MPKSGGYTRTFALATVCFISTCILRADDQSKAYFKAGEQALAAGNTFTAYENFKAAVSLRPSNHKYIAKMQETAKLSSARADDLGQAQLVKDLKEAKKWFEAALKYDPSNTNASQHLAELNQNISAARDKAISLECFIFWVKPNKFINDLQRLLRPATLV